MPVIFLLIIGAAAGFLATRIMDIKANVPTTIAIGVLGALIGGVLLRFLMASLAFAGGIIGALLGAVVLIWVWRIYFGGSK